MIPFQLAEPASLAAAIGLLDPDDPTIRPIYVRRAVRDALHANIISDGHGR